MTNLVQWPAAALGFITVGLRISEGTDVSRSMPEVRNPYTMVSIDTSEEWLRRLRMYFLKESILRHWDVPPLFFFVPFAANISADG